MSRRKGQKGTGERERKSRSLFWRYKPILSCRKFLFEDLPAYGENFVSKSLRGDAETLGNNLPWGVFPQGHCYSALLSVQFHLNDLGRERRAIFGNADWDFLL